MSTAMMAMTTSNSISVKPRRLRNGPVMKQPPVYEYTKTSIAGLIRCNLRRRAAACQAKHTRFRLHVARPAAAANGKVLLHEPRAGGNVSHPRAEVAVGAGAGNQ